MMKKEDVTSSNPTRQEEILNKFLELLLEHCKKNIKCRIMPKSYLLLLNILV